MKTLQLTVLMAGVCFSTFFADAQTNRLSTNSASVHHTFNGTALLQKLKLDGKQFVTVTNRDYTFTNGEVTRIEPNAIYVVQGNVGARFLLKNLPESIQTRFQYSATDAEDYEKWLQQRRQAAQQLQAQQTQQAQVYRARQATTAEQANQRNTDIKAMGDKVEEVKGVVLQMLNDGILVQQDFVSLQTVKTGKRASPIIFMVNYPGRVNRVGRNILASAVPVGDYHYLNTFKVPLTVPKYDAHIPSDVVQYLRTQGITVYPAYAYPR